MGGHQTRTSVLAWNSRTLASGSRDRNILQHDLRVSSDYVSKLIGHKSEVESICINDQNYLHKLYGARSLSSKFQSLYPGMWLKMVS